MPHRQKKHIPAKDFFRYTCSIAHGIETAGYHCLGSIARNEKPAEHHLHTHLHTRLHTHPRGSAKDDVHTVLERYGIPDSGAEPLYVASLI